MDFDELLAELDALEAIDRAKENKSERGLALPDSPAVESTQTATPE